MNMKSIDKPSSLLLFQTILGVVGFLVVVIGVTVTDNLYGEIEDVETDVEHNLLKIDSQETKINEINVATREILVEMKWQKIHIEDIATKLNKAE